MQTHLSSSCNKSSKGEKVRARLLMMSLQQMRKHLDPLKSARGYRAVRQTRAQATRHTCTCCPACNYCLWDGLGKRGVGHLQLKQGYCKLSIIQRVQMFNLSRSVTPPNDSIFETQLRTRFYKMTTKTYFSHQSVHCSRLHSKCRIFQLYAGVIFPV